MYTLTKSQQEPNLDVQFLGQGLDLSYELATGESLPALPPCPASAHNDNLTEETSRICV